jgi:hypothetical protein
MLRFLYRRMSMQREGYKVLVNVDDDDEEDETFSSTTNESSLESTPPRHSLTVRRGRRFTPHPCKRILYWDNAVESDDDIWVERSYISNRGLTIYYYCSMKHGRRQLLEPPTGASTIVYQEEIARYPRAIQNFARQPMPLEDLRDIPHPKSNKQLLEKRRRKKSRGLVEV